MSDAHHPEERGEGLADPGSHSYEGAERRVEGRFVEVLTANVENLATEAALLRQEIVLVDARQNRDRRVYATLIAVVVTLIMLVLGIAFLNRQANVQVQDCVTPGGECFEQRSVQQRALQSEVVLANIIVVNCAFENDVRLGGTQENFETCVRQNVEALGVSVPVVPLD